MKRPNTLAEVAARVNAGAAFGPTLSEFLDEFYEHPMLGAVGEHLARRWALAVPAWTNDTMRFLHEPYFTTPIENLRALLLAQSPQVFRRRMIFTEAEPLRRARMPRRNTK